MQTLEYEPEIARLLWMRVQLKQQRAQNIAQKPEIQLHSRQTAWHQTDQYTSRKTQISLHHS